MIRVGSSSDIRYKMAIVVRQDIKMGKGKVAAQVGHASVEASETTRKENNELWKKWIEEGQCKVVLKTNSEEEFRELQLKAKRQGLPVVVIRDRGLTQIDPDTVTCMGIGPGPSKRVDEVTGHLRLL
jgi:PTH2 family peptidyl-tRNA hydrolase